MPTAFSPVQLITSQEAAGLDFQIQQGTDWNDSYQLLGTDALGADANLLATGDIVEMVIRPSYTSATVIARLRSDLGGIVLDLATSAVQIYVASVPASVYPAGTWTHVTHLIRPGTANRAVARGAVQVLPATF